MEDHAHNNRIFHIKRNTNTLYCNILSWVAWTAQLTMFLAELRRWWDRCSYKMHLLAARAYITGRVFSALGLLTLPREFLVWGKVQKGLHYHCSGACSSKTFLVCKRVQWVLYYKGVFSPWFGALIHYKAISRLGKVQQGFSAGWDRLSDLFERLRQRLGEIDG